MLSTHLNGKLNRETKIYHVRFEVFADVNMKNVVFWGIKSQFVPHRRQIISLLRNPASCYVRFEVFTAVIMKNGFFWDIKSQFVPHRKYITCLIQSQVG
jgi:hypothetical protein